MKTKFAVFTLSLLMVLTMAPDAFAQESVTFQVSSGATVGRMNGHTEMAGGITLALITGGLEANDADDDADGSVVVDYGLPITNAINAGTTTIDNTDIEVVICGDANTIVTTPGLTQNAAIDGSAITLTVLDDVNCNDGCLYHH